MNISVTKCKNEVIESRLMRVCVYPRENLHNYQLLDEVEQNITIYRWRADQLFADAEGRGK